MLNELRMSRESRKVISCLNELAIQNGVAECLVVPSHILMCDILCMKFYTQPILNVIRSHVRSCKNKSYKTFTIDYMYSIINSKLGNQESAKRNIQGINETIDKDKFPLIIKHLLTDYSIEESVMINSIINTYDITSISNAILESANAQAFSVRYINVVLENMQARKNKVISDVVKLGERIEQSDTILNATIHNHTPLDIAMAKFQWDKKVQDNELVKMFTDKFGGLTNENS